MAKKDGKISKSKEYHSLKCELTKKELLQAGEDLANAIDAAEALANDKKAIDDEFKAKITAQEATIAVKQRLVRNKNEFRSTECELTLNYTTQKATVVRLDTNEVISEREMTVEEKQMKMEFDKEPKEEAA